MGMFDFLTAPETSLAEKSAKHREEFGVVVTTPYVPPKSAAQITEDMAATRQRGEQARHIEPAPVRPYVPITYTPVSATIKSYTPEQIAEYAEVAELVGVAPADLKVEEFKTYLRGKDFPVYDLSTVVAFMDAKSKAEGKGWGWNWVPLRDKDRIGARFGTPATRREMSMLRISGEPRWEGEDRPASDHYSPYRDVGRMSSPVQVPAYSQVVPLHALKKVALIEKEFKHSVSFMVSDYAPAPAFKADPFLMAVIHNAGLASGEGRFVIDVWDEPGFGIEHMLKSGL